jgi:hypothetical protein
MDISGEDYEWTRLSLNMIQAVKKKALSWPLQPSPLMSRLQEWRANLDGRSPRSCYKASQNHRPIRTWISTKLYQKALRAIPTKTMSPPSKMCWNHEMRHLFLCWNTIFRSGLYILGVWTRDCLSNVIVKNCCLLHVELGPMALKRYSQLELRESTWDDGLSFTSTEGSRARPMCIKVGRNLLRSTFISILYHSSSVQIFDPH